MALFKRNFDTPGPGVPKNAPKKKGLARFFEILGRDFGNLFKLNFFYFLCVLPALVLMILALLSMGDRFVDPANVGSGRFLLFGALALAASITVGPARTSMTLCITKMLRDDPGFVWHDFKKGFKENFKSTALPGLFYSLVFGSQVFAVVYYALLQGSIHFLMIGVYLFAVLMFIMSAPYFFVQAAYLTLSPGGLLKNSLFLALGYAPRSFAGAAMGGALGLVQILTFPASFIFTVLIGFSIPTLINLMWIWPQVDKTFQIDKTLRERAGLGAEEDPDNQTPEDSPPHDEE